jgi:exonuclease III
MRYRNDDMFASRALADRHEDCYIMSDEACSDHSPVVSEFWA